MIPPGPWPLHVRQVDAVLPGHEAHGWGGERPGRRGRGRVGWGRLGGDPLPVPAAVAAPSARRRLGRAVADQHRHLLVGFARMGSAAVPVSMADACAARLDGDQRGPDADRLPRCGQELDDGAGEGAGQLDDGLLGLHLHEDLVQGHLVPDGDVPRHELGFGEPFTEVGQDEVLQGAHDGSRHRSTSWRIRSASGRK